jgi:hypothetical protein
VGDRARPAVNWLCPYRRRRRVPVVTGKRYSAIQLIAEPAQHFSGKVRHLLLLLA